ncbi:hypothetical protein OCU04_002389 [Sclerotinia nivalis]|uniref:Apple domain-containing protein n=1 Tax=Sclerotinia nivalis TaxID=352851 RepID=A0A9X0ATQ0_9HELO|nr:hypothetical protein OCU04_002389 [Sclerotinia nivalis]
MTRLTSLILLTIASLAIASPLNPMVEVLPRTDASQDDTPTPSTTNAPTTTTTTTSSTIVAKNIGGCNVQGTADVGLSSKIFGTATAPDIVSCQSRCGGITACISYSYDVNTTVCTAYNQWMDNLVSNGSSGIFFSDKYPDDGTNFCYSYS